MALKRKDELYMTDENGNAVKPSTVDKTAPTGPVSPSVTNKEETKPSASTGSVSHSATSKKEDIFMVDANGNKYDPLTNKPVSSQPSTPSTTTPTTPTTATPFTKIPGLTNKAPVFGNYTPPQYAAPDKYVAPEKYSASQYNDPSSYVASSYAPSEAVKQATQMLADQMAKEPGQYNSPWATQLNDTLDKILNREKFSYDFNGDAFYQQYKDKFTQQARAASDDAIARASALTGGYGNSYAATVGAQAYNAEMQKLNDVIPELYQMAYDKYAREGQELKDAYSMLSAREQDAYGRYRDEKADYLTDRDYFTNRLDVGKADDYNKFLNDRNFGYNQYVDDRNFGYNQYVDDRNYNYGKYVDDRNFGYNQYVDDRNFGYGQYVDDRNFGYGANRDTVADKKWQSEFDLAIDQYNKNLELSQREAEQAAIEEEAAVRKEVTDKVGKELEKFDNNEDMANYLATLVNREEITEEEAAAMLDKYAYADLADREWRRGDNNLDPVFNIPTGATMVTDQYGNEMTLKELQDKLISEGMSELEFQAWYEKMLKNWGYAPL
jgi:hypothetical protein